MTEIERISHCCHDFPDVSFWHAARATLSNQSTSVSAVHVVHRDPEPAVELTTIENADDMWVPQRRCQFGFANESCAELLVGGGGQGQDLQGVVTRQTRMLGEVNLTHTASAEQALDH